MTSWSERQKHPKNTQHRHCRDLEIKAKGQDECCFLWAFLFVCLHDVYMKHKYTHTFSSKSTSLVINGLNAKVLIWAVNIFFKKCHMRSGNQANSKYDALRSITFLGHGENEEKWFLDFSNLTLYPRLTADKEIYSDSRSARHLSTIKESKDSFSKVIWQYKSKTHKSPTTYFHFKMNQCSI